MKKIKPKVSTKPTNYSIRENRIKNIMREAPEGMYPKIIALYLRENVNTIKSTLRKMESECIIKKDLVHRGLYHLVENKVDGIFDFKFQNLILTTNVEGIKNSFSLNNGFKELLRYRIKFCKNTSNITLRLRSPRGIGLESLLTTIRVFILEIEKETNKTVSFEKIILSSIELNRDYTNLRLDGFNCLTIESLIAQYKLYQKRKTVREEYKVKVPMTAKTLFELLNFGQDYAVLSMTVDALKEELKEMRKILIKILAQSKK